MGMGASAESLSMLPVQKLIKHNITDYRYTSAPHLGEQFQIMLLVRHFLYILS
jgi:hypothetical protein